MATDYKTFYSAELRRLRQYSLEFARDNPALAPMLGTPSVDPDIERLLEGVAFLNGHTRHKLSDEFPEIAQELASILVPQILRPMPAATMMVFEPKAQLKEPALIPAGTELASKPIQDLNCRFTTTIDLEVTDLSVQQVSWTTNVRNEPNLRIELKTSPGAPQTDLPQSIRFFLGDNLESATVLLMLFQNYLLGVDLIDSNGNRLNIRDCLVFPGFEEQLVPQPDNGVPAFGLIRELLSFPEKFLFIALDGLQKKIGALPVGGFTLQFQFERVTFALPEVSQSSFMLHVAPAVNLFAQSAEPIELHHQTPDYLVLPAGMARQHHQVFTVESVIGLRQGQVAQRKYVPFALLEFGTRAKQPTYRTSIKPSMGGDWSETYLSVVYEPEEAPIPETLSIELLCTNRWLAEELKLGEVSEPTDTSPERCSFRNITAVKGAVDAPTGDDLLWACISHTAMNFMSLGDTKTIQSLLSLYNNFRTGGHSNSAVNKRQIEGIRNLEISPQNMLYRGSMIRGQAIRMLCDQSNWPSIGAMYLWGCVLSRFFATYATINMYTTFQMRDADTGIEFQWPPMLGNKPLI